MNLERSSASGGGPKACPSCGARFPADALFCSLDGSPLTTSPMLIAAAASNDPYLGREILGHIEIRQLVGIGSMGRVYRAFQRGIDRDVAVKILHRELSSNAALVARFDREAKVASRLAHPNVVHVLLVGQLPDGAMYIVMEYLDGLSLQSALAGSDGVLPLPRALHIAVQLSDAAGEGHAQGIVHRDLKPENVMLVRRADDPDFVKVLDFGVARVHWGDQSMATAAGLIFGTARYISPEGARGEKVGPQGDVYSIATMLYQMLSGRPPFHADQAVALLVQQIHDPPPPIDGIPRASYVPAPIAAVIMKNLSKKPEERADNGRAFGRALLEAAISSGLSAQDVLTRPAMLTGAPGSHPSVVQMPSMQRTRQMQLDPDTAMRIAASTAYETPVPARAETTGRPLTPTEITDPFALPPGMSTSKWTSPSRPPSMGPGIDQTLDEQQPPMSRASLPPTRSSEFEMAPPLSSESSQARSRASQTPVPGSKPASSVETTMAGDEAPIQFLQDDGHPRQGVRVVAFGLVVAILGITAVAWRAGVFSRTSAAGPSIEIVQRGHDSIGADRRGAPSEAPAQDDTRLQPSADSPVPPLAEVAKPVALSPLHAASTASSTSVLPTRAVLDAPAGRPGVGQPVDFSAHIVSGSSAHTPKVGEPHFLINGPGIAGGAELTAADDGTGVYRTSFTFLQEGQFDVVFSAHADGAAVRAARVIVVAASTPALPPSRPQETLPQGAGPGGKWL